MGLSKLLFIIFSFWIFLRTVSYGIWTWKKKNKFGGAAVMLMGCSVIIAAVYEFTIKK